MCGTPPCKRRRLNFEGAVFNNCTFKFELEIGNACMIVRFGAFPAWLNFEVLGVSRVRENTSFLMRGQEKHYTYRTIL